ncbi:lipid IV(A) palmitoyltransferase PagP [Methylobacillus arboreus]|uniref:lipid IV(A) palmitoyltransferase PagP n=1 Tax=Methylobacillus arboreus TaxID=755170 RepID=UPI001E48FF1F|nr:lipid IV(A) palmitoyltransferase PagP [Methylobacillus arboreus]MCB5191683.1 lipid IV(A) palmitoyltransferase PagP [Methylobacillus arboreus]
MKIKHTFLAASSTLLLPFSAQASCNTDYTWVDKSCERITDIWETGSQDLYLPLWTHHLRFAYDDDKIDSFREFTWGLGYGRSRYNAAGNWEGLYLMAFSDSHSKVQPMLGYGHQWMFGPVSGLHAGVGYTAFITSRADIYRNFPIPGVLPIASVNYQQYSLNTSYVPGGRGNGNILFFWSRASF